MNDQQAYRRQPDPDGLTIGNAREAVRGRNCGERFRDGWTGVVSRFTGQVNTPGILRLERSRLWSPTSRRRPTRNPRGDPVTRKLDHAPASGLLALEHRGDPVRRVERRATLRHRPVVDQAPACADVDRRCRCSGKRTPISTRHRIIDSAFFTGAALQHDSIVFRMSAHSPVASRLRRSFATSKFQPARRSAPAWRPSTSCTTRPRRGPPRRPYRLAHPRVGSRRPKRASPRRPRP